jgi:hypothetical protein
MSRLLVERNTARTQSSLQLGSMLQSWLSDIPRFQDSQGGCPPLSREGVVGAAASILELNTVPVIWTIKPVARSNVKAPPEIPSSNSRILHQAPAGNPKPLLLGGSLPLVKLWHVAGQVPPMEVRGAQGNEEQWDTKNLDANCEPVTSSHSPTAANVPAAFHPYLYRCREPLAPHLQVCFHSTRMPVLPVLACGIRITPLYMLSYIWTQGWSCHAWARSSSRCWIVLPAVMNIYRIYLFRDDI